MTVVSYCEICDMDFLHGEMMLASHCEAHPSLCIQHILDLMDLSSGCVHKAKKRVFFAPKQLRGWKNPDCEKPLRRSPFWSLSHNGGCTLHISFSNGKYDKP